MADITQILVAIVDDHALVRKGIAELINQFGGMEVVIEADSGYQLIEKLEKQSSKPDVCLMDVCMKGMNGFDTLIAVKKRWPDIKVLAFSYTEEEFYILKMITNGAKGYISKSCSAAELKEALQIVYDDGVYFSEGIKGKYKAAVNTYTTSTSQLTPAEILILENCCNDLTYEEIGKKLGLTTRSVEGHRDSIFRKLKINSRQSLALFAVKLGIVPLETATSDNRNFIEKNKKA